MKPIAIPRPTDPEMRRQWDEAKRAVEAREQWPARHRERVQVMEKLLGGLPEDTTPTPSAADDDCCVGDRSRCRCAPERGGWSDEDVEREKWIAVWAVDESEAM